ncbi:MAG: DUF4375 domain-containing protein [Phycisphaerales bacterium JB060]
MDHDTNKLYDAIDRLPGPEEPGWDRLTPSQQQLICMSMIEGQVTNGGFHQVYFNGYQQYLPLALAGYRAIGAKPQAEIVELVLAMVRDDPWSGPPDIWPDPDAEERPPGSRDIGVFDQQWYALDLRELRRLKLDYLNAHPDRFRHPSKLGPNPP